MSFFFSEYLTRWREKLSLMKHSPAESNQLMILMEGCVPLLSRKRKYLGIKNFKELHNFGVQKDSDLAQDKKYFSGRSSNREGSGSSSVIGPSHNIQISVIQPPQKFFNMGRPLSKVLEKLIENNLI